MPLLRGQKTQELLKRGQDGGVTSALLVHALNKGTIKGAVLGDVLPENPQVGVQKLATTPEEIIVLQRLPLYVFAKYRRPHGGDEKRHTPDRGCGRTLPGRRNQTAAVQQHTS